jgi:hypothetical protein
VLYDFGFAEHISTPRIVSETVLTPLAFDNIQLRIYLECIFGSEDFLVWLETMAKQKKGNRPWIEVLGRLILRDPLKFQDWEPLSDVTWGNARKEDAEAKEEFTRLPPLDSALVDMFKD